jgi:hypothetical protein
MSCSTCSPGVILRGARLSDFMASQTRGGHEELCWTAGAWVPDPNRGLGFNGSAPNLYFPFMNTSMMKTNEYFWTGV